MKTMFKRFKVATAVALALAVTVSIGATQPASAGHGRNAALLGGLAAGAVLGSAIANNRGGSYDDEPALRCYITQQPVYDEDGDFAGYRRARVCE